ncbi:MAG: hypothetical protein FJW26_01800 [Acidimicrobiia bacterium]|nr:hypothetical protein [Acidimicrobiia bacterium]
MNKLIRVIGVCLLSALSLGARGLSEGMQPFTPEFPAIKQELQSFQEIIQKTLLRNLLGPVPVLSTPKGTYLPDYGAVFNVEGNLYEIRAISPFGQQPRTQKELDDAYYAMLKRVEALRTQMLQAIGDYGASLEHLKPEETLAVVVHLFSGYDDPKRPCPTQLIFRVKKAAVVDYRDKKLSFDELLKKVEINRF